MIALGALALVDAGVTLRLAGAVLGAVRANSARTTSAARCARRTRGADRRRARALASLPDERARSRSWRASSSAARATAAPVGRIVIPRIGASYVVVKGTGTKDSRAGPGIYAETSFPGVAGTTAIAGHRTTYLAPFRHIDSLSPRQPHPAEHALRALHLHGHRPACGGAHRRQRGGRPGWATPGSCCRRARRCSARPNACWCSRGLRARAGGRGPAAARRCAGAADR